LTNGEDDGPWVGWSGDVDGGVFETEGDSSDFGGDDVFEGLSK